MAKKFKYTQNPLVKSSVYVGAGIGTAFGLAFLEKQVAFLSKNKWLAPTGIFVLSVGGVALTPKDSFGKDLFVGMTVVSGVDAGLNFWNMAQALAFKKKEEAGQVTNGANGVNGNTMNNHRKTRTMGRTVWPKKGPRMGKNKNYGYNYMNFAR